MASELPRTLARPDVRQDEQPPFANTLGIKVIRSEPERIETELLVRPELGNRNGNMHGGAVMAFADHLGGAGIAGKFGK